MKKIFLLILTTTFSLAIFAQSNVLPASAQKGVMYVKNATIHVGNGKVIENGVIQIRDGKIAAAVAPGLAPFVAARAGVGASFEGGLAYTGRGLRIDLRRSFPLASQWDLSLGAGASAPFYGGDDGSLRNVDLSKLRGYGADVPALVGYESPSSAYKAWFGARGGFDRVSLENVSTDPRPGVAEAVVLEADRLSLGAVVGGALGYRHLHVGVELQAGFISISGRYNETAAKVSGLAITPATALSWPSFIQYFFTSVVIQGLLQLALGVLNADSISNYFNNNVIEGMLPGIGINFSKTNTTCIRIRQRS